MFWNILKHQVPIRRMSVILIKIKTGIPGFQLEDSVIIIIYGFSDTPNRILMSPLQIK